jgi:glyoxylase-like metal-dependent hydrolase (beta-lactamase superfamily II)
MGFGFGFEPDANEWMTLTSGHISINKFWGETERVRAAQCTCSLVKTAAGLLLVDPSVRAPEMPALLHEKAGLRPEDVSIVFLTHSHGDHWYGLEAFPQARWLMAAQELDLWRARATAVELRVIERIEAIEAAGAEVVPGVRTLLTPGHTPGTTSLVFRWRGRRVAIAGDGVMTAGHFRAREGHSNSTDLAQAAASIDLLQASADVVIPGHGPAFVVAWEP